MIARISKLYEHLEWADAKVLAALRATPGSDPRGLSLYNHVLAAEHVWCSRIRGTAPRVAVWPSLALDECAALAAENAASYRALIAGLVPADLARAISYVNSAGAAFTSALEDMLLHVALHGSYHRGQVALVVRDGGGEPAPTDYIAFTRGAPAATRQPSA